MQRLRRFLGTVEEFTILAIEAISTLHVEVQIQQVRCNPKQPFSVEASQFRVVRQAKNVRRRQTERGGTQEQLRTATCKA